MGVNRRASTISVVTRAPVSEATHWTLTGNGVTVSQIKKNPGRHTYVHTDGQINKRTERQTD